jgi:hypothetical protein
MMEQSSLLFLCAMLHPINRVVKSAISARGAGSQFVSQQMLAQNVFALLANHICQRADTLSFPAAMRTGFPRNPIFRNK